MTINKIEEDLKKDGYYLQPYEKRLFKSVIDYVKAVPKKQLEILLDIIKPEYDKIKYLDYKYEINDVKNNV